MRVTVLTIDDLLQNYLSESRELLAQTENSLLTMEIDRVNLDEESAGQALASLHAVKAGAALFDLPAVSELAHQAERALALMRWRRVPATPARIGVLLNATDRLRDMIDAGGADDAAEISPVLAALAALPNAEEVDAAPYPAGRRLRALLVEDESTSRLLLETFLRRYGDCDVAVDGREAVERVLVLRERGEKYDLICMDIMMPEMDGVEALRRIRGMEAAQNILPTDGVKIVMTTAVDNLKQVAKCFSSLCDAYLVKPIDLQKLLGYLRAYRLAP